MGLASRRSSDEGDEMNPSHLEIVVVAIFLIAFSPTQHKSISTDSRFFDDHFAHQTVFLFKPKDTFFLEQRKRLLEVERV